MNPDLPHTFVFSPPDDALDSWNTGTLDDFPQRLDDAFPGASALRVEPWDRNTSRTTFSFELPWGGEWLEGLITTPSPGTGSLTVNNATPHEAAAVLSWFREQYVPPTAAVVFTTGLGLDNGVDDTARIPAGVGTETLAELLGEHAEAIERALGS